jgi:multiple sugar transport system ATP-binding protein
MGAEIYLYLDIEGVLITARVDPKSEYNSGETATLHVNIEKLYLFNKETEEVYK